ncbi:MAG: lipopolysaccharide biosynthesis protein [Micromonosporaceae bacterium]
MPQQTGRQQQTAHTPHAPAGRLPSAVGWSYVLTAGRLGTTTLVTFVLAWLLGPRVLGVATMAMVFVTLAQVLLQQGLISAIVQRVELRRDHLDAAFWVLIGTSVLVGAGTLLLAPVWATVNRLPELTAVCVALIPLLPLQALAVVPEALLRRDLRFRPLALRATVSVVAGGAAGVTVAAYGGGVWALVVQQLVTAAVGVVVLWTAARWRPRLRPTFRSMRDLAGFSTHSATAGLGVLVGNRADILVMGLFFGPLAVGLYRFASRITDLVVELSVRSLQQVALPELSRLQDDHAAFARRLGSLQHLGAVLGLPLLGVLSTVAAPVLALLGPEWLAAVEPLRLLCAIGAIGVYGVLLGPALQAAGRPGMLSLLAWIRAGLGVAAFAIAGYAFRDSAVAVQVVAIAAIALGVQALITVVTTQLTLHRVLGVRVGAVLAPTIPAAAAGGIAWLVGGLLDMFGGRALSPFAELLLYGSVTGVFAFTALLASDPRAVTLVRQHLGPVLGRRLG